MAVSTTGQTVFQGLYVDYFITLHTSPVSVVGDKWQRTVLEFCEY